MAKLHDLPTQPTIDRVGLVLGMMVLHNEICVFQLKGCWHIESFLTITRTQWGGGGGWMLDIPSF